MSNITEDARDTGRAYIPSPAVVIHYYSFHLPHLPGQEWTSHHLRKPNTWDPQTAELMWLGRINSWMKNEILAIPKPRTVKYYAKPLSWGLLVQCLAAAPASVPNWTMGDKAHGGFHAGAPPTSHPLSSLELLILAVKPPYHISVNLYMC